MTAEGQSDKMASDMEVRMEQRCVIEFLQAGKIAPNDIHRRLLNVYGDQGKGKGRLWVIQHCCLEAYCTLTRMSSFIHLQRRCTHQAA